MKACLIHDKENIGSVPAIAAKLIIRKYPATGSVKVFLKAPGEKQYCLTGRINDQFSMDHVYECVADSLLPGVQVDRRY